MFASNNRSYSIILTNACCLRCSHCFLGDSRKTEKTMSIETAEKITDKVLSFNSPATINWGGGEPLILGKEYMRKLTSLNCFADPKIENTIYSTFLIDMDRGWKEILERFDSLTFSLDSYRIKDRAFDAGRALTNLSMLNIKKSISYTPSPNDDLEKLKMFYLQARDIGADTFHMGFLYGNILAADVYLDAIDRLLRLKEIYAGPEIGFFDKVQSFNGNPYAAVGWRAYDCFTKAFYFCGDVITSCYILYKAGYNVPTTNIETFLNSENIEQLNDDFIRSFFIKRGLRECGDCEYYSICMGGCPYFVWESNTKKDPYCEVYKKVFTGLEDLSRDAH